MKKNTRTVAMLAVLSIMAVGCQKESLTSDLQETSSSESITLMHYSIDGVPSCIAIHNDAEQTSFIQQMVSLAESGHNVSFGKWSQQPNAAKEVIHYSAKDKDSAYAWADKKLKEGYAVNIEYDPKTQTYNCTAIK